MRRRETDINPHAVLVQGWQRQISSLVKKMRQEYYDLHVPADAATAVMYAEYLATAANFLDRANEMLAEHIEVIERNQAWEEAQKRWA